MPPTNRSKAGSPSDWLARARGDLALARLSDSVTEQDLRDADSLAQQVFCWAGSLIR